MAQNILYYRRIIFGNMLYSFMSHTLMYMYCTILLLHVTIPLLLSPRQLGYAHTDMGFFQ